MLSYLPDYNYQFTVSKPSGVVTDYKDLDCVVYENLSLCIFFRGHKWAIMDWRGEGRYVGKRDVIQIKYSSREPFILKNIVTERC